MVTFLLMVLHDVNNILEVGESIGNNHASMSKNVLLSVEQHTGKAIATILLLTLRQPWIPHHPLVLKASATSILRKLVQQVRRKMVIN